MAARALFVSVCLLVFGTWLDHARGAELVPSRESLARFPMAVDGWNGERAEDFDPKVLAVLGVDDYLNRIYTRPTDPAVGMYVGYYISQREGDTIHSPLNCLPGSGWQPIETGRISLAVASASQVGSRPLEVNRYIVQKGLDKLVVLYWYQSHGRVIASEYRAKAYLVLDALHLNRTDGALIRLMSPWSDEDPTGRSADRALVEFANTLFPMLGRYLPT